MSKQQIGVVGMAVMGRNLALNIESRGYTVSIFNRSRRKDGRSDCRKSRQKTRSLLYGERVC
ncbi:NAD(P)-binding domain-containing protein [Escherichia coli]